MKKVKISLQLTLKQWMFVVKQKSWSYASIVYDASPTNIELNVFEHVNGFSSSAPPSFSRAAQVPEISTAKQLRNKFTNCEGNGSTSHTHKGSHFEMDPHYALLVARLGVGGLLHRSHFGRTEPGMPRFISIESILPQLDKLCKRCTSKLFLDNYVIK